MADSKIQTYWESFCASSNGKYSPDTTYDSWSFGDNPELADGLAKLVLDGTKTATAGLLWEYQYDGDKIPEKDNIEIILDSHGQPICILEITEVRIIPFDEVDTQFAFEEGEGDRSLESWRKGHWTFFSRICHKIGKEPDKKMKIICQRFRRIFPQRRITDY